MSDRFTQTVDIETPELVVLSYTVAGLGSRVAAALIDLLINFLLFIGVFIGLLVIARDSGEVDTGPTPSTAWAVAFLSIVQFLILWGYYLLFEGLCDGQTPGKRLLRLRAVRDGGFSVGFSASAVRNLMRIIDLQPGFTYLIGILSIAFSKTGKRLGDIVAGTIVVREAVIRQPMQPPAVDATPDEPLEPATALLTDAEFQLLERWSERRGALEPARRKELAVQVANRVRHALPPDTDATDSAALMRLLASERRARERGASARGATGASRERFALITTSSSRWIAFAARLREVQRRGLRAVGEVGVRDFVSEYRALSQDFARLRTSVGNQQTSELFYLGRLVAGAHNILYRSKRIGLRDVLRFLVVDVPAEVRRSAVPILIAAAFLFVPAAIAYTAVVTQPSVASVFIPTSMLDRAEDGVQRARNEECYIPDPEVLRPVMASRIIANNVQVTFAVFAFGITAGLGTLALLLLNGVSLGGVFGLYASKNILPLLLAFVAPHGVLELSAVCIAGGAGLLIAAALMLPGTRTRRRALAENSRRAMRLIAASTLFLLVAGSLEGLVSPIPWWPLSFKLSVSAITLLLMYSFLRLGAHSPAWLDRLDRTLRSRLSP